MSQMNFDFPQKVRDLFDMGGYCRSWETGMNDADCLHHILGRVSDSPYNAAPLNNFREHMNEGRKNLPSLSSPGVISKYLKKTKKYLDSIDYKPNKEDLDFIEKYKEYFI